MDDEDDFPQDDARDDDDVLVLIQDALREWDAESA